MPAGRLAGSPAYFVNGRVPTWGSISPATSPPNAALPSPATIPPGPPAPRAAPAPKPRPAQDLAALLAQRPDLVAAALASPVDLDGHSPDARDIRRRHGVDLAAQLYPGILAAQLAVETIIAELRLKPGNPKLPPAIATLASDKPTRTLLVSWLIRLLRSWPRADVGFDLVRYYNPERRAAIVRDSTGLYLPALTVVLDAIIDRDKLRRALLSLTQHADATQRHERLARNLASVLSLAARRSKDEGLRLFCRRHFAQLSGLNAVQRFDYARKVFPDLLRDGEVTNDSSADAEALRRAWKEVAAEHPAPDHPHSAAASPATERQAYTQRRRAHLRVMDAELRDYCRKHREILGHLSEAERFAFASAKETAYFIIERDAAGQAAAKAAFRRAWQVVAAEHV